MTYWNTDLFVKTPQCGGCNGWYYVGDITYYCANPDHTPIGTLLFNSSPTEDTSLRVLYQTVNVEKNTNYKFSAMVCTINNAIFNIKINGEEVVSRYELSPDGCSVGKFMEIGFQEIVPLQLLLLKITDKKL
ncbi:MAG: hypothetical protein IPF58_10075 [Saprospirales bacterium]|nr:hypothetical protein [Saprospirales bacterium]